jgi:hypothetical protein
MADQTIAYRKYSETAASHQNITATSKQKLHHSTHGFGERPIPALRLSQPPPFLLVAEMHYLD